MSHCISGSLDMVRDAEETEKVHWHIANPRELSATSVVQLCSASGILQCTTTMCCSSWD